MAYMSQEKKKELAPGIKAVLKKYGMKGTIGVRHYSSLVVNIKSGPIAFDEREQVNQYYIKEHYEGTARDFMLELYAAMMVGNHNNSDIMTDYFDVGWYTDINVGKWDKPYIQTA